MTTGEYAGLVAATLSSAGIILAGLRWIVKAYLHELVPNHGSSIKDKINRLEERVDEIYRILAEK